MSYFLKSASPVTRPERHYLQRFKRREQLPTASLWRLECGIVRVVTWNDSGDVIPLGFWGAGSLVGGALVAADPYEIQALTPVVAERLSHLTPIPEDIFVAQTRQTAAFVKILHCRQVEERLLRFFCWLMDQFGQSTPEGACLPFRLTHQELADAIATTRVTVTRTLRQLEAEGYLKWSRTEKVVFYSTLNQSAFPRLSASA
ncbi:MAG: Crp/Fnr family transcriptional regulator [Cyanobacteria bacterium J06632_22]